MILDCLVEEVLYLVGLNSILFDDVKTSLSANPARLPQFWLGPLAVLDPDFPIGIRKTFLIAKLEGSGCRGSGSSG